MRGGDEMTSRLVVAGNMYIAGASLYTSLTSENYGLGRSRDLCVCRPLALESCKTAPE